MEETKSRRTAFLIIIAALLLHLLALLFLLAWQHHSQENERKFQEFMEEVRQQKLQDPESEEWAEMKARESQFGTTVMFQDTPEYSPAPNTASQAKKEKKPEEKPKTIDKEDTLSPEKIALVEKDTTSMAQEEQQEVPSEESVSAAQNEYITPGMAGASSYDAAPEPPITLATIAKGFLSTLDQGGQDSMSMHGRKGAHPSAAQLNYLRFREKISRCISNSHHIHRDKLPHTSMRVPVSIAVSFARDGRLIDSYVVLSSGMRAIDEYVLFIHRDASSSFPPVPTSIKDNQLSFISEGIVIIGQDVSPLNFSMR